METKQTFTLEGIFTMILMIFIALSLVGVFILVNQFILINFFDSNMIIKGEVFIYIWWIVTLVLSNIKVMWMR